MKIVHESIFTSAFRSFCIAFFAVFGLAAGTLFVCGGIYALLKTSEEETYSSDIKMLPDEKGSRKKLSGDVPVLLQIDLTGQIGKDELTSKKIEKILLKSREDHLKNDRVKGILLYIDSPGGGVGDSDRIYRLVKEYKEKYQVPVFAYIDGMCASGGYYISCAADKIFASQVSLVGSVGVLSWPPFVNVSDTLEKIGVDSLTLFAGKGKDQMNPLRPWKEGEQEAYQKLINFYYGEFTSIVCKARPQISQEKLTEVYGAGVFPAPEAQTLGFIDECGAERKDVLKQLASKAGIAPNASYQVIGFETKSWLDKWLREESFGTIKHEFSLQTEAKNPFYFLFRP